MLGRPEAIVTGTLAGFNAVKYIRGESMVTLSRETAIGDIIAYANERLNTEGGNAVRHTFSGAEYFERMKELGLYSTDNDYIEAKIERLGLKNIFK